MIVDRTLLVGSLIYPEKPWRYYKVQMPGLLILHFRLLKEGQMISLVQ